jgi:hypothetical protein
MTNKTAQSFVGDVVVLCLILVSGIVHAQVPVPVRQQLLYVPIYSEIPFGDQGRTLNLAATISVRNTDRTHSLTLKKVDYYNSKGGLVRVYLSEPCTLKPMASAEFFIKEADRKGGISSSILVDWNSEAAISPPLVEAVMISTASSQGISFSSAARVLEERP